MNWFRNTYLHIPWEARVRRNKKNIAPNIALELVGLTLRCNHFTVLARKDDTQRNYTRKIGTSTAYF